MATKPTRRAVMARTLGALTAGVWGLGSAPARAYQVSPMIFELEPSGRNASAMLYIENTAALPLTVEVTVERRVFDEQGAEARTPAPEDFVLFPPQAVVPAGGTQAIRVQYNGPATLASSVMYTVTVRQLPVNLPLTEGNGVRFVFNFSAVVNVVPPASRARIVVQAVEPLDTERLALRIANEGDRYANLAEAQVTLSAPGFERALTREEWREALGVSWLLPGAARSLTMPSFGAPGPVAVAVRAPDGAW